MKTAKPILSLKQNALSINVQQPLNGDLLSIDLFVHHQIVTPATFKVVSSSILSMILFESIPNILNTAF